MSELLATTELLSIPPEVIMRQMTNAITMRSNRLQDFFANYDGPDVNAEILRQANYLKSFYNLALVERFKRADDVESEDIKFADKAALEFLNFLPYRLDCIDGRNKYITMFGITPGVGGDLRVPAGSPQGFIKTSYNSLWLDPNSDYAISLRGVITSNELDKKVVILDSHLHCAAQGAHESSRSPSCLNPSYPDNGLLVDVKHKKEMHTAIDGFAMNTNPEVDLNTVQISYDPTTNYMYMGLEKEENIKFGEANNGYSLDVLDNLVTNNKIISTKHLADDSEMSSLLEEFEFKPNWIEDYRNTGKTFWINIKKMASGKIMDKITNKVREIYGDIADSEIETRSKLILLNLYSGYLNNTACSVKSGHHESTVNITEKDYGPHDPSVSGFQVSRFSADIPGDVALGNSIVLSNRRKGLVQDFTGNYQGEEWTMAPYTTMVQAIDRNSLNDWKKLADVDFSDISKINWVNMETDGFFAYIDSKSPKISFAALKKLEELRLVAIKLIRDTNNSGTGQQIQDGTMNILYTVTDASRRPVFILPLDYPHIEY